MRHPREFAMSNTLKPGAGALLIASFAVLLWSGCEQFPRRATIPHRVVSLGRAGRLPGAHTTRWCSGTLCRSRIHFSAHGRSAHSAANLAQPTTGHAAGRGVTSNTPVSHVWPSKQRPLRCGGGSRSRCTQHLTPVTVERSRWRRARDRTVQRRRALREPVRERSGHAELREGYGEGHGRQEHRRALTAFIWWTAWGATTERPGDTGSRGSTRAPSARRSLTNNWPCRWATPPPACGCGRLSAFCS